MMVMKGGWGEGIIVSIACCCLLFYLFSAAAINITGVLNHQPMLHLACVAAVRKLVVLFAPFHDHNAPITVAEPQGAPYHPFTLGCW